jgi:hypothetical protein
VVKYFKQTFAGVPSLVFDDDGGRLEAFFACAMRHDRRSCAEYFKGNEGTIVSDEEGFRRLFPKEKFQA